MRDGDAIAADLSDPDLFELWIASDSDDTFEEWAEKRCGVVHAMPPLVRVERRYLADGIAGTLTVGGTNGITYSVEPYHR